ncbi:MAG: hypothetical protein ACYDHM_16565 [Acidiferrobacterales bacterium]
MVPLAKHSGHLVGNRRCRDHRLFEIRRVVGAREIKLLGVVSQETFDIVESL